MHLPSTSLLFLAAVLPLAAAGASPDWIVETPRAFLATGRFQPGSDGTDLVVVDKDTGLARIGRSVPGGWDWIEQPLGLAGVTGFTTLRHGARDRLAATSPAWNAVQLTTPGDLPETLGSPVVGPIRLVRLATGHAANAVVEDLLALTRLGDAPSPERLGALTESGTVLFETTFPGLPEAAQFLPLGPAPALPVLVGVRQGVLHVDRVDRSGLLPGGFDVSGPHPAGLRWTAGPLDLFAIARDGLVLERHRIGSAPGPGGFRVASGVDATFRYPLPEPVAGLDTVPFADPDPASLGCLLAVRFVSSPDVVRLCRLSEAPPSVVELAALEPSPGEGFAGLLAVGPDFLMLGGPEGRVASWSRHAQPAPGSLPVRVATGSLPPSRPRAEHPNLFLFDRDPFLAGNARFTSSQNLPDWTTVAPTGVSAETDGGASAGLRDPRPLAFDPLGAVAIGNQLLPSASVAGFGPVAGPARDPVQFHPPPGGYAALAAGQFFPVTLRAAGTGQVIRYRLPGGDTWLSYEPTRPIELGASGALLAYAENPVTGATTPIATGWYAFAPLPPLDPVVATDANGNGLGDAWERAFGISDPASDTDGDGANAATEQLHRTDPLDPYSRPQGVDPDEPGLSVAGVADSNLQLAWPAALRGHVLESSVDLREWTPVEPQPTGTQWSAPITEVLQFYRLREP